MPRRCAGRPKCCLRWMPAAALPPISVSSLQHQLKLLIVLPPTGRIAERSDPKGEHNVERLLEYDARQDRVDPHKARRRLVRLLDARFHAMAVFHRDDDQGKPGAAGHDVQIAT